MRYRVTGFAADPAVIEDPRRLAEALARVFRVATPEIQDPVVIKRSLDARRRPARHIFSIELDIPDALTPAPRPPRGARVSKVSGDTRPAALRVQGVFASRSVRRLPPSFRPVVIGAGPAGLFAALALARLGAPPLVIERGRKIEARTLDERALHESSVLDSESNLLFGEGGAAAFSDGKIYTRTRSPQVSSVLKEFVELGVSSRILIDARPHIGADEIGKMLTRFRQRLEGLGVELRFESRVTEILCEGGAAMGVRLADGSELRRAPVLLAAGHSARDTYELLLRAGVRLEAWSTAIGLRVEHPQALIDRAQYKVEHPRSAGLPPADYHLARYGAAGRGAYTFCMCPGGAIVAATHERGRIVTGGAANSARGGPFANAGVVVQVRPDDYLPFAEPGDPLAGLRFQEHWERLAAEAGGGGLRAPAQRAPDFLAGRLSATLPGCSYEPGIRAADLRSCLPDPVVDGIAQALHAFGRRIRGFDGADALLLGVETRTSSPVRILRDEDKQALGLRQLYVVGEGAGYAGGIVSAAVDGVGAAEQIINAAALSVAG